MIGLPGAYEPVIDAIVCPESTSSVIAADPAGGIAVEERHDVTHLLGVWTWRPGLVPVVLREGQPEVGVGLGQRRVGRSGQMALMRMPFFGEAGSPGRRRSG